MKSVIYIILMVALWVLNLYNGSGLGEKYHTTEYLRISVIIVFIIVCIFTYLKDKSSSIKLNDKKIYGLMFIWFFVCSLISGNGINAIDYLWLFLLIYIIGKFKVHVFAIHLSCWIIGGAGITVLWIYNYGSLFAGWNPNSIAMLGMHSFLFFMIPFYGKWKLYNKIILIAGIIVYTILILPTDSRSCVWFAILAFLFSLRLLSPNIILGKENRMVFWLLVPLIVAVLVSLISNVSLFQELNTWSQQNFGKPIFNGRDKIWIEGFNTVFNNFIFGTGNLKVYYHNSAISVMVSVGIIGYIIWILSFYRILRETMKYKEDNLISGMMISFIILYFQQSVELGLFADNAIILPYVLLGMMLGRANSLNELKNKQHEDKEESKWSSDYEPDSYKQIKT